MMDDLYNAIHELIELMHDTEAQLVAARGLLDSEGPYGLANVCERWASLGSLLIRLSDDALRLQELNIGHGGRLLEAYVAPHPFVHKGP